MAKYDAEQTATAVKMYAEKGNAGLDEIAEALGFARRSIIAKLTREGVYVAAVKAKAEPRPVGPTKGEILSEIGDLVDFEVDGLSGATRDALLGVLGAVKTAKTAD